ncbi:MAG: sulfite exporter TauE/SafE family protein [Lachnospiraceae bacterium]|nr:sulfite exporter TauE/SafE family protein [Lachnospiraceae bacterium]
MGAGIGTGLAGLSAAAVISPMLVTFLGFGSYEAITIALASDVLASAASAYTYWKNKNLDIRGSLTLLGSVLVFTMIGSYVASLVPQTTVGNFSIIMTFFLGLKFIFFPVMTTKDVLAAKSRRERIVESLIGGAIIGSICGFVGAGGGMMMLLVLTSVLNYELKTAVGTSVFVMSFTAFTGAASHVVIGGMPDIVALIACILFTLLGAQGAAKFANGAEPRALNQITGVVLTVLGAVMIMVHFF